MLKKILLAIALLVGYFSIGQVPNGLPQRFSGKWYQFQYYASVDSGFLTPLRDTNYRPSRIGAVTTRPSDSLMYRWTGSKWDLIGRGGTFGVYSAGNGLSLSGNTFSADTSSVGLATRNRVKKVADSLGALISGTVPTTTSVSTSFGLEGGGTLSTSLSLEADTLQLSTRAWRQKGVDSVRNLLNNYVLLTRNVTTGYGLSGGGNLTTDRTILADTTNQLASKLRLYKVVDSLGGVIGSITTDTTVISTRAWRQKGLDSIKFAPNTWSAKQTFTDSIIGVNERLTGSLNFNTSKIENSGQGIAFSQTWDNGSPSNGLLVDITSSSTGAASQLINLKYNNTSFFNVDIYGNGSIIGTIGANSFVKSGGTSSQALLADGTILSNPVSGTGTANTLTMFTGTGTIGNSALSQTSTTMTLSSRKLNINLPTDTSIVGTLVGTGTNVGAQWVFKNDYNTTGGFVGIAAGETSGDMVLAVGANKKLVFGIGTAGNSRGAEFSENALKIFQIAGNTSNWVSLGALTGTHTWLFGSVTTGSGFTLKTTEYVNVNINGVAYKLAVVN